MVGCFGRIVYFDQTNHISADSGPDEKNEQVRSNFSNLHAIQGHMEKIINVKMVKD